MTLYNKALGRGPALVFFHGWGFDHSIWNEVAAVLSEQFTVYLVDLPGFGQSPMMGWGAFKSQLLKQLPEKFAVVGWSLGGLFATRLAIEEPSRITHLLNISTSPCFFKNRHWPGVERLVLKNFFINLTLSAEKTLTEFVTLQLQGTNYAFNAQAIPSLEGLTSGLKLLSESDLRDGLHGLNLSVCYMFGRLDAIVPRATMKAMQRLYPHFNFVLFDKAAHIPFITHQVEFIDKLKAFLGFDVV